MNYLQAVTLTFAAVFAGSATAQMQPVFDTAFDTACAQDPASKHAAWSAILKARVAAGVVDYEAIRTNDSAALKKYLDQQALVVVQKLPAKEQLAFYINLYNASVIAAVLDHTKTNKPWQPSQTDFAVLKAKRVRLSTGLISLRDLRHKVLRPKFPDPRVQVALCSGARSGPVLLSRAYEAKTLDQDLEANLKAFLADPSRNHADATTKSLHVSKLFEWFEKDFGGAVGVRRLLGKQFGEAARKYDIVYKEFDWRLNGKTPVSKTPKK